MLVKIYTENPSEKEIDRVVNLLERDGVVILSLIHISEPTRRS